VAISIRREISINSKLLTEAGHILYPRTATVISFASVLIREIMTGMQIEVSEEFYLQDMLFLRPLQARELQSSSSFVTATIQRRDSFPEYKKPLFPLDVDEASASQTDSTRLITPLHPLTPPSLTAHSTMNHLRLGASTPTTTPFRPEDKHKVSEITDDDAHTFICLLYSRRLERNLEPLKKEGATLHPRDSDALYSWFSYQAPINTPLKIYLKSQQKLVL
jgi:hypothetical protein